MSTAQQATGAGRRGRAAGTTSTGTVGGHRSGPALGLPWQLASALPVVLPTALAAYGVVAIALLLVGQLRPALTLPLGLAAGLVAGLVALRSAGEQASRHPGARWADLAALVAAGVWTLLNLRLSSQNISVFRDPATYALAGEWLVHHPAAPVDVHAGVFGSAQGLVFASNGFPALPTPGQVQPQGAHLIQALVASAGWLGGNAALLRANVVVGAIALLAVYAFARRIVQPWFALGAVAVLAATLPMAEFSRAVYTEPLAMAFAWGGFALVWLAHEAGRRRDFVVAGLVVGATALTRIDGLLSVLAVLPYLAVVVVGGVLRRDRQPLVRAGLVGLPAAAVVVLAVRDLQTLAPVYYHDLGDQVRLILRGFFALTVVCALAVGAVAVRRTLPKRAAPMWLRAAPPVAFVGTCALMAALASRPLWLVDRNSSGGGYANYVTFLQKARHLPIDGTRGYAELTVKWISWYVGVPAVVLGTLGLALLLARTVRRFEPPLVLALGMVVLTGLLYLVRPSITPDQVWASRRLLPLAFPGVLVGVAVALTWLLRRSSALGVLAVLLGVLVGWNTVDASQKLWGTRQYVPQLAEVTAVCAALPDDAAVLVGPSLVSTWLQTVRSYCDVPVAGLKKVAPATLASVRTAAASSGRRLYALSSSVTDLPGVEPSVAPFSDVKYRHWNATLTTRPSFAGKDERKLYLAEVQADGQLRLLPSTGPQPGAG